MNDPNLIRDLAAAGLDPDLLQRVVLELARATAEREAIKARRANEALRTRTYRERGGGLISSELRAHVLDRDRYTCAYCGSRLAPLTCDHVVPVSRGGETTAANLVASCGPCNSSKCDLLIEEWGGRCR